MIKEHKCLIFNCDHLHRNQCCNFCKIRFKCKNRCLNNHKICGQYLNLKKYEEKSNDE